MPPQANRTKVSIAEIVEDANVPVPVSSALKRKADVLDAETEDADEKPERQPSPIATTKQAVETSAAQAEPQRPKKRLRRALNVAGKGAVYAGKGAAYAAVGVVAAVGALMALPDSFFE
jgi:hypothetical protein